MTHAQKIKMLLGYVGVTESELARRIGTSPQALHQRMKTDKFSSSELERMAAAVGARYSFEFVLENGDKI